jgi:hypothetical protein
MRMMLLNLVAQASELAQNSGSQLEYCLVHIVPRLQVAQQLILCSPFVQRSDEWG